MLPYARLDAFPPRVPTPPPPPVSAPSPRRRPSQHRPHAAAHPRAASSPRCPRSRTTAGKSQAGEPPRADALRRLVPGGSGMEYCSLLEETADYVCCLREQGHKAVRILNAYAKVPPKPKVPSTKRILNAYAKVPPKPKVPSTKRLNASNEHSLHQVPDNSASSTYYCITNTCAGKE